MSDLPFDPVAVLSRRPIPVPRIAEEKATVPRRTEKPDNMFELKVKRSIDQTIDRAAILERIRLNRGWTTTCTNPQKYAVDVPYQNARSSAASPELTLDETSSSRERSETERSETERSETERSETERSESDSEEEEKEQEPKEQESGAYRYETGVQDLGSDDVSLILCSGAKTDPLPGKGSTKELLPADRKADFIPSLSSIPGWRKKLCNSWVQPFALSSHVLRATYGKIHQAWAEEEMVNMQWDSVNHYLTYQKYRSADAAINTALSDYDTAKEIGAANGKYQGSDLPVNPDYAENQGEIVYGALFSKFASDPSLLETLLATKDASLHHRETDSSPKTHLFYELMLVRSQFSEGAPGAPKPKATKTKAVAAKTKTKAVATKKKETAPEKVEGDKAVPKKTQKETHGLRSPVKKGDAEFASRVPRAFVPVTMPASYMLANRRQFVQSIGTLFRKYRVRAQDETTGITCAQLKPTGKKKGDFSLLEHQLIVRDYMNTYSPYESLLLFHGLGAGKTCSSIALGEGAATDRRIFVLQPKSLSTNFWSELSKCGNPMFKTNQFWEFVTVADDEAGRNRAATLASALSMDPQTVLKNGGAWLVDIHQPSNYDLLSADKQKDIGNQVNAMMRYKYTDIHYNANNLGRIVESLKGGKEDVNPFDNSVIIIDEAHNLVSRIVGKLKDKQSMYSKLYHLLMNAQNARIIMLTGTPITNYPNEIAPLFNILRRYIRTWEFKVTVTTTKVVNQASIERILETETPGIYDYVQYANGKFTVTRNPFGFVNKLKTDGPIPGENKEEPVPFPPRPEPKQTTKRTGRVAFAPEEKAGKKKPATKRGGASANYQGVTKDERGTVSDDEFIGQIVTVLAKHGIVLAIPTGANKNPKLYKALPDDPKTFMSTFVKPVTKPGEDVIMNRNVLVTRILGLVSYFRSAQEKLLPTIIPAENGDTYHIERVPMSDYQFGVYAAFRTEEYTKEMKAQTRARAKQGQDNQSLDVAGSYRIFSRIMSNFVFPENIEYPKPTNNTENTGKEKEDGKENDEADIDDAKGNKNDATYDQRMTQAYADLKANSGEIFSPRFLPKYSQKMATLLENIVQNEGSQLVYSNFRNMGGIGVFQLMLEENGFSEFKIRNVGGQWTLVDFDPKDTNMRYVLYTGTESEEQKEIARNIYNGAWEKDDNKLPESIRTQLAAFDPQWRKNVDGSLIRLFMITAAGAEGITLEHTRIVHVLEPYWHPVRGEQVIGRARRICSHADLPLDKQTVKVYLYLSVMSEAQKKNDKYKQLRIHDVSKRDPNRSVTTDENLYEISQIKADINSHFLRAIKESAMDCALYVGKHNETEKKPLVCYNFGKVTSNEFSVHPNLEIDVKDQATTANKPQMESFTAQEIAIRNVKYAWNPETGDLYNFVDYTANKMLTLEGVYDKTAKRLTFVDQPVAGPGLTKNVNPKITGKIATALEAGPGPDAGPSPKGSKGTAPEVGPIDDTASVPFVPFGPGPGSSEGGLFDSITGDVTPIVHNRINVTADPKKCSYLLFKNKAIEPTIFPFVSTASELNLIKAGCAISPTGTGGKRGGATYTSQFNPGKFESPVYRDITDASVKTTIDYIFKKMKTAVFVRIRNGHVANFVPIYNTEFTNDFSDILRLPGNMSVDQYLAAKTKGAGFKARGKVWERDMSKWNATNCLIRNEGDDRYPTTGYLAEMYDMMVETCGARQVNDCVFVLNRKDFAYLDAKGNETYDHIFGDNVPMADAYYGKSFLPTLSQSTTDRHADIPIPTSDDWCHISRQLFADPSSKEKWAIRCTNAYLDAATATIPSWKERKSEVFWRGMGTGCGNTAENNPRLKISTMNIPGLNAGIVSFTRRDKVNKETRTIEISDERSVPGLQKKGFVERADQLSYRFVLNIEGNSAAYRYGSLFAAGYCVLNVESQYTLWFEPFLKDREHFIRVKHDLSNLAEIVAWCIDPVNDAECQRIAANGLAFHRKYFNREFVYDYMADVFNACSAVTAFSSAPEFMAYADVKKQVQAINRAHEFVVRPFKIPATVVPKSPNVKTSSYVIVVPFRDNAAQGRRGQLDRFLAHYAPVANILVVTQTNAHKFNRGALLNAGFHFLNSTQAVAAVPGLAKVQSYVFHDVDLLIPLPLVSKYYGTATKRVSADLKAGIQRDPNQVQRVASASGDARTETSSRGIVHMGHLVKDYYSYPRFLGGILEFSHSAFLAVNGFPNHMYGWGGEDDALGVRISSAGLDVYRPDEAQTGTEMKLAAANESQKQPSMTDEHKLEDQLLDSRIWRMNGVNSVQYKVVDRHKFSNTTYGITVEL